MLLIWMLGAALPVVAQDGARLVLKPPETDRFPNIGFFFEAYDADGSFITDLQAGQVQVIEDETRYPLESLERTEPGLQLTIAFNAAPQMANRVAGLTHFSRIKEALQEWAQTQPASTPNDYSLATNTGLQAIRLDSPAELVQALEEYQPDLLASQASLVSLTQSLDIALDATPRPYMKNAVLYITPLPTTAMQVALPSLAERAAQQGTRIFVWLVTQPTAADSIPARALRQLAESSGGEFFLFSGTQALPDLDDYLQPLRYLYRGSYQSRIRESGLHRLAVEVQYAESQALSEEQVFTLRVLPPNPIFLSPPARINRVWSRDEGESQPVLRPEVTSLKILIEFPDGYPRSLRAARLYVDDALVLTNTRPPFDQFEWSLEEYTESQRPLLRVEVEDILGLTAVSFETPVEIAVEPQRRALLLGGGIAQALILGVPLLVAGLALFAVLVVRRRGSLLQRIASQRRALKDPVRQPVRIRQEEARKRKPAAEQTPTWPQEAAAPPAPARLLRLSEGGHPLSDRAVPVNRQEITFGSDPKQAIYTLDAPSVDGLHARLYRRGSNEFFISDAGSTAGTWVNYTPVSAGGMQLEDGDLIHIGRVAFRFELADPPNPKRPSVTPFSKGSL